MFGLRRRRTGAERVEYDPDAKPHAAEKASSQWKAPTPGQLWAVLRNAVKDALWPPLVVTTHEYNRFLTTRVEAKTIGWQVLHSTIDATYLVYQRLHPDTRAVQCFFAGHVTVLLLYACRRDLWRRYRAELCIALNVLYSCASFAKLFKLMPLLPDEHDKFLYKYCLLYLADAFFCQVPIHRFWKLQFLDAATRWYWWRLYDVMPGYPSPLLIAISLAWQMLLLMFSASLQAGHVAEFMRGRQAEAHGAAGGSGTAAVAVTTATPAGALPAVASAAAADGIDSSARAEAPKPRPIFPALAPAPVPAVAEPPAAADAPLKAAAVAAAAAAAAAPTEVSSAGICGGPPGWEALRKGRYARALRQLAAGPSSYVLLCDRRRQLQVAGGAASASIQLYVTAADPADLRPDWHERLASAVQEGAPGWHVVSASSRSGSLIVHLDLVYTPPPPPPPPPPQGAAAAAAVAVAAATTTTSFGGSSCAPDAHGTATATTSMGFTSVTTAIGSSAAGGSGGDGSHALDSFFDSLDAEDVLGLLGLPAQPPGASGRPGRDAVSVQRGDTVFRAFRAVAVPRKAFRPIPALRQQQQEGEEEEEGEGDEGPMQEVHREMQAAVASLSVGAGEGGGGGGDGGGVVVGGGGGGVSAADAILAALESGDPEKIDWEALADWREEEPSPGVAPAAGPSVMAARAAGGGAAAAPDPAEVALSIHAAAVRPRRSHCVRLSFSAATAVVEELRVVLRHVPPASFVSGVHIASPSQEIARTLAAPPAALMELRDPAAPRRFYAELSLVAAPQDLPSLVHVELWRGRRRLTSRPLLLAASAEAAEAAAESDPGGDAWVGEVEAFVASLLQAQGTGEEDDGDGCAAFAFVEELASWLAQAAALERGLVEGGGGVAAQAAVRRVARVLHIWGTAGPGGVNAEFLHVKSGAPPSTSSASSRDTSLVASGGPTQPPPALPPGLPAAASAPFDVTAAAAADPALAALRQLLLCQGRTLLSVAVEAGRLALARHLWGILGGPLGAAPGEVVEGAATPVTGLPLLHAAVKSGIPEMVDQVVSWYPGRQAEPPGGLWVREALLVSASGPRVAATGGSRTERGGAEGGGAGVERPGGPEGPQEQQPRGGWGTSPAAGSARVSVLSAAETAQLVQDEAEDAAAAPFRPASAPVLWAVSVRSRVAEEDRPTAALELPRDAIDATAPPPPPLPPLPGSLRGLLHTGGNTPADLPAGTGPDQSAAGAAAAAAAAAPAVLSDSSLLLVTPLHLALAIGDGGRMATHILNTYCEADKLWSGSMGSIAGLATAPGASVGGDGGGGDGLLSSVAPSDCAPPSGLHSSPWLGGMFSQGSFTTMTTTTTSPGSLMSTSTCRQVDLYDNAVAAAGGAAAATAGGTTMAALLQMSPVDVKRQVGGGWGAAAAGGSGSGGGDTKAAATAAAAAAMARRQWTVREDAAAGDGGGDDGGLLAPPSLEELAFMEGLRWEGGPAGRLAAPQARRGFVRVAAPLPVP